MNLPNILKPFAASQHVLAGGDNWTWKKLGNLSIDMATILEKMLGSAAYPLGVKLRAIWILLSWKREWIPRDWSCACDLPPNTHRTLEPHLADFSPDVLEWIADLITAFISLASSGSSLVRRGRVVKDYADSLSAIWILLPDDHPKKSDLLNALLRLDTEQDEEMDVIGQLMNDGRVADTWHTIIRQELQSMIVRKRGRKQIWDMFQVDRYAGAISGILSKPHSEVRMQDRLRYAEDILFLLSCPKRVGRCLYSHNLGHMLQVLRGKHFKPVRFRVAQYFAGDDLSIWDLDRLLKACDPHTVLYQRLKAKKQRKRNADKKARASYRLDQRKAERLLVRLQK